MKASRIAMVAVVLLLLGGMVYGGYRVASRVASLMRRQPPAEPANGLDISKGRIAQKESPPSLPEQPRTINQQPRISPRPPLRDQRASAPAKVADEKPADAPAANENLDGFTAEAVNAIRLSDDADNKRAGFWLEQPFALGETPAGKPLFKLFAGIDAKTMQTLAVVVYADKAVLEIDPGKAAGTPPTQVAEAKLPPLKSGANELGVLWRNGELGVWLGTNEFLTWKPAERKDEVAKLLALPSAFVALAPGVKTGPRRSVAFDAIRFDDSFMRQNGSGAGEWKPIFGHWEITSQTFVERSANPFSLRASFKNMPPFEEDPLNAAEKRVRDGEYGSGMQISFSEGTPHIVRITGGGPAAHAGLAEDDIFIRVNGIDCSRIAQYQLYRELNNAPGGLRLVMYRPGERALREFSFNPQGYKWGVSVEATPLAPIREVNTGAIGDYSFIAAGDAGWSDYEAEAAAKPLGAGGFGVAVAVRSDKDFLLFRWLGPHERSEPKRPKENVLQLVEVKDGNEKILAEKPAHYRAYEFYRMGVAWRDGKLAGLIDRNEILSADVPEVKRGKIGLWALKGNAVFFDDVHVAGDRAVTAAWRTPERALNSIFALEDDMEAWANPALEWERDVKTPWAIHKQRFPGDQAVSIAKPRFSDLTIALFCGADPESGACPRLTIRKGVAEISGVGFEKQSVDVGNGPFNRVSFDAGAYGVRASIDGKKLNADWGGVKPHLTGGRAPGLGERLAIRGLKNLGDHGAVRVTSSGTLEYTFDGAPSDWKVASGRWGQLNKWICDPRWSWFGGRTKTVGAIWNKHIFSGDVSVDAHVATMMMRDDPPFERPGDFNLTICGDGDNLDSGYTLIFGGDLNSWTRLYRKGVQVAEATDEKFRVFSDRIRHPDKPDLHQRWFHLKLEKIGDTISFYRDDVLAFKFTDPEPLPDGRVAYWTLDNGFLLSRLRIAHNGARPAPFEDGRSELFEDARVINMFDGEYTTSVAPEALPAEIVASLQSPPDGFKPASAPKIAGEQGGGGAGGNSGYRVTNGVGGGPFALQFKTKIVNIESDGVVRFAYRIEPGAKVDLYLMQLGFGEFNPRHQGCYRWRMSGQVFDRTAASPLNDEFSPLVGEIPSIVADGNWHTVQYDLQPSWHEFWRKRNMPLNRLTLRLMFCNLDNANYLLAGMGGNHAGAVYAISEVQTFPPSSVTKQAPRVTKVTWPFDAEGDGHSIKLLFDDGGGNGIESNSIQVSLNGTTLPTETVRTGAPCRYDQVAQTLSIDCLRLEGLNLAEGTKIDLALAPGCKNRAGQADAAGFKSSWTYHTADALKANKLPAAPVIHATSAGETADIPGDEALRVTDVLAQNWMNSRAQESPDYPPWAPANQRRSVEAIATSELTSMGFQMRRAQFDMQRWPYLEVDYRVPLDTPFNLLMTDEAGSIYSLLLVDVEDGRDHLSRDVSGRFGPAKEFIPDGTWRRSILPIRKLFMESFPTSEPLKIRGFSFEDRGWKGGRRGLHWNLHRIQPVPAGRKEDLAFSWSGEDITGVANYESSVDDNPLGDPKGKQQVQLGAPLSKSNVSLKDGWNYVHVRMKNGAGVWSETAHRKFFLDTSPPRVTKTEPPDGGTLTGQTFKIFIEEENAINVQSVILKIDNDQMQAHAEYDPAQGAVIFNALRAGRPFVKGDKVTVELSGLADTFGNRQTKPFVFHFTANPQVKVRGPEMTSLVYSAPTERSQIYRQYDMELSFGLNFEEHCGHVHNLRDCKMEWLNDEAQAAGGKRAVKFTCLQDDGDPQVMLHKNAWFLDKLPLLHFDYKADPGFNVDLHVEVYGVWHSIKFLGTGHAPNEGKALGAIADITADGKWHHASVDLRALIEAAGVRMPSRIVNKIVLSGNGEDGCRRGATLSIDNLDMVAAGGLSPRGGMGLLKYKAEAGPIGIDGYSLVFDQNPNTVPPAVLTDRGGETGMQVHYGTWYAHVRACDQAGNWGETKTIRLELGEAGHNQPFRGFEEN